MRDTTAATHSAALPAELRTELLIQVEQLQEALASRTTTSQATGLLAARFRLHTDQAWDLLRESSNMSNRKLADIAGIVVDTHNEVPITDEADQRVALALITVLDSALARVRARGYSDGSRTD